MKTNMPQPQLDANEAELIRRVCEGEREAFYELVRPYEHLIYVTAISVLRNAADAEEAVLRGFSRLSSFRAECKFSTWLVRASYSYLRRLHRWGLLKCQRDTRGLILYRLSAKGAAVLAPGKDGSTVSNNAEAWLWAFKRSRNTLGRRAEIPLRPFGACRMTNLLG